MNLEIFQPRLIKACDPHILKAMEGKFRAIRKHSIFSCNVHICLIFVLSQDIVLEISFFVQDFPMLQFDFSSGLCHTAERNISTDIFAYIQDQLPFW